MDIERALISKIVATGRLDSVVGKGISTDMFADEDCRDLFDYILANARIHKKPPSMEAARHDKPEFEFYHVEDSIEWVINRFSQQVKKRMAHDLVLQLTEAIVDPKQVDNIEGVFFEAAREIATVVPSEEVRKFSDIDQRREDYVKRAIEGEQLGIPFGFPRLDDMTGGILPWEFVTCAAFSGVGKSTLLRAVSFNVYSSPDDRNGLYVSLEENADGILSRFDAMATHLSYKKMKQLGLDEQELEQWDKAARAIRKKMNKRDIWVLDKIRPCTPDRIFAEITRHGPDICFIDYLSLMRSSHPSRQSSMWQSLTEITQDLKQAARVLEVPILAAAQTNRSGAKDGADLDNIGYALSVVQDSDIVLGLHADEDMKREKRMEIRVRKNREGPLGQLKCIWDHEKMVFRQEDQTDRFGRPGAKVNAKDVADARAAELAEQKGETGHLKRQRPKRKTQRPRRPT